MKRYVLGGVALVALTALAIFWTAANGTPNGAGAGRTVNGGGEGRTVYDFTLKDVSGKDVSLAQYRGKVLLLVNVASKCGYTPQYEGLQKVYARYQERGFLVLGFPANNFGGQEPGTNEEIKEFCRINYGVKFPVFAKISVKGEDKHPLYKYLTEKTTNPEFGGEITWNFNKFLIDREGRIVARFDSADKPEDEKVTRAIEQALGR
jgi:glutathione peroxidase